MYDTVYVVSCIYCGGCIEDFLAMNYSNAGQTKMLVFDEQCSNGKYIDRLKKYAYVSIKQDELEQTFGEFGNMIVLYRQGGRYVAKIYPQTQ